MNRYEFTPEQRVLLESLQIPFAVYQFLDKRVTTLLLSDGFCDLFGYENRNQALHEMDTDMYRETHPDDAARIADAAFRFATEDGIYDVVYRARRKGSPHYHMIHARGKHVYTENATRLAYIWYTDEGKYTGEKETDPGDLVRAVNGALCEESLMRASHYDYLTGMPSMAYFFELAEAGKQAIRQRGENAVLLFLDFSGMRYYNTKYGFSEGDRLLRAFSRILIRHFSNENCCHIGGDHFTVFTEEKGIEPVLETIFQEVRELNGGISLPVRVGIYQDRMEDVPASMACDRAKYACDALRNTFLSSFGYYSMELSEDAEKRQYVLTHLEQALEEGWVQVWYQPIVRAVTGRVCDEEALARWIDPERGFLSPAEFIPYLEEAGIIYLLDLYVVDQVLIKLRIQKEAGLFLVPQSVNLSRSDFQACDIVEEIRRRVDESGFDRSLITIEITESIIGSNFEFMKQQVERFLQLGFHVWMDDFGSCYSSLDVLQSIQFNLIKFDMSFMRKLEDGDNSRIVLTEMMKMATALKMDTLCEGVETPEQVTFLQEIGCSKLQGYHYARPMSLEKVLERYEKGIQIGFEDPKAAPYYDTIGRINLYDLTVIAQNETSVFHNLFNTLPMGIMEVRIQQQEMRFVRSNQSCREFMQRFYKFDSSLKTWFSVQPGGPGSGFMKLMNQCCGNGSRAFFDEQMSDGTTVHFFARRIGVHPVSGLTAVALAVLSLKDPDEGADYASIARALASDYYNIYYVDLETEKFIEYSSAVGEESMVMERHGEHFFDAVYRDSATRIYKDDRAAFLKGFTRENIVRVLDKQGVFATFYRLIDSGKPVYAHMKITRMLPDRKHLIIGINLIDRQMKLKEMNDSLNQASGRKTE